MLHQTSKQPPSSLYIPNTTPPATTPNPTPHGTPVLSAGLELELELASVAALAFDSVVPDDRVALGVDNVSAPVAVTLDVDRAERSGVGVTVPSRTRKVAFMTFQTSVSAGTVKWFSYPLVLVPILPELVISHEALVAGWPVNVQAVRVDL